MPTTTASEHAVSASVGIRPFAASDSTEVADLLVRAFDDDDGPAPPRMADYLREVYLDAPWFDADIASRVLVRPGGGIAGFVGVSALPMSLAGRSLRAAVISSLAVDPRHSDPLMGLRLLRDVCSGPQDAMLNDRSNAAAVALLRSLKGEVHRHYSFEFVRSLRPAGFAIESMVSRFKPARLLAPLARAFDDVTLARSLHSEAPRWTAPSRARAAEAFTDRELPHDELLDLVPRFLAEFPLRPDWTRADLSRILADASCKATLGAFVSRVVDAPNGAPVGLFLYHLRKGRVAHVLQIMATKGREGVVVDRAIGDAAARGAVAIRGRAQPALLGAWMERRAVFLPELSTVVFTRDAEVLKHFRDGTAFFCGLAGENWMRLNGDRFS